MSAPDLTGRRVLVTGGSGFIGRHVVAELTASGAVVRVIDLQPHPDPTVDIVVGDIADPDSIGRAFSGGMDSIVHLAAETSVLKSVQQPERTFHTNVIGTNAVLQGGRAAGVTSLAFASTNAVTGPMTTPKISESLALNPLTPYGATKAADEMLMSAYTAVYGMRCAAIRLTNVYGPGMQAKDSIIARLMRCIRLGTEFEVYGEGAQIRDYVHAQDVMQAMTLALCSEAWSGPMVIGSGESLSVLQVIRAVESVTGREIPFHHGPAKAGEMPAVVVDPARAHAAGWSPRYPTLADGLPGVWEEWSAAAVTAAVVSSTATVPAQEYDRLDPRERGAVDAFLAEHPAGQGAPVAVVIPAYNEEPTVAAVVGEIPSEVAGLATETIVVVDGAQDQTARAATCAGALVCDVAVNRGQGAALKLGYWLARARGARVIVTIDADGQYEAEEIARVVAPILADRADFVSGSRRLGTELTTDSTRHAGVIVFGLLISLLVRHRVTDPACGLRAMAAQVTADVILEQPQYQASELQISAALHGYRLGEVPTTMRDRGNHATATKKGGNLGYGVRFARAALHTWWRDRNAARIRERPAKTHLS